jgi:hypothetical protein
MRLIDADALKKAVEEFPNCYNGWSDAYDKSFIIGAIEEQPSIDPMRGEWIRDRYWSRGVGMGEEYGFFYKCSLCEYEVENGYTRCGFNFCPYCGADMRKEK